MEVSAFDEHRDVCGSSITMPVPAYSKWRTRAALGAAGGAPSTILSAAAQFRARDISTRSQRSGTAQRLTSA